MLLLNHHLALYHALLIHPHAVLTFVFHLDWMFLGAM
jgi:hypothetical protein